MPDLPWDSRVLAKIKENAKLGLEIEDIAALLGVPRRVLERWLANTDAEPYLAYANGRALTHRDLAKRQIQMAVGKSDRGMLVHLGKTLLGQKIDDKETRMKRARKSGTGPNIAELISEFSKPGDD